jgi:hypothetical protein
MARSKSLDFGAQSPAGRTWARKLVMNRRDGRARLRLEIARTVVGEV